MGWVSGPEKSTIVGGAGDRLDVDIHRNSKPKTKCFGVKSSPNVSTLEVGLQ